MGIREAKPNEQIKMAEYVYRIHGPIQGHNYYCAVCRESSAVIDCSTGILQPCWECQKTYKLIKLNWFLKLFCNQ